MLILLAFKWLCTTLVVIVVSLTAARVGPGLGGILAGTPMVFAPGYFFMLQEQSARHVAEASLASLHALLATLAFCLVYVLAAGRRGAWLSLTLAVATWIPLAVLTSLLPGGVWLAAALFCAALYLASMMVHCLATVSAKAHGVLGFRELMLRGGLAGAMVCLATALAEDLDPGLAGIVLSFPVAMLSIAWTLQQRSGAAVARATLAAALPGMLSLVAFCGVLALTAGKLPSWMAFTLSLLASLVVSILLLSCRSENSGGQGMGRSR